MAKQTRHQSVINRQSDADYSENHWLRQFEASLQKTSVQPRGKSESLYDQINSIMNTKSKYPSVQAAVDDMMQRSGLTAYLDIEKTSQDGADQPRKIAQQQPRPQQQDDKIPTVIKDKPSIKNTLDNIIRDSKGNLSVPTIISRLHSIHAQDISDEGAWEDERLIRLVSRCNLEAKKNNPGNFDNYSNLGTGDHSSSDSDIDPSNTDAFNALMPAKI